MTEPKTEVKKHFILRFWRQKKNGKIIVRYCKNYERHHGRREWGSCEDRAHAYKFKDRSDAMSARRSNSFEHLLKGPRKSYYHPGESDRHTDQHYFWEVVEVIETIVTTYEESVVKSDAPAMLQIAREL